MSDDPRDFPHPVLPAGYNADDLNGDEFNGAGTNHPVWPNYTVMTTYQIIVLMSEEMMSIFDTECPDLVIACQPNTILIPGEPETINVRKVG